MKLIITATRGRQHRPQHADIRLPINIIKVSARVSKRVLIACPAAQISGHTNGIPEFREAAHFLRGQHDAHVGGVSFSEKLQTVKNIVY